MLSLPATNAPEAEGTETEGGNDNPTPSEPVVEDPETPHVYTAEELGEMTKAEILALAEELEYELEVTDANTKEEIITAFLAAQNAE